MAIWVLRSLVCTALSARTRYETTKPNENSQTHLSIPHLNRSLPSRDLSQVRPYSTEKLLLAAGPRDAFRQIMIDRRVRVRSAERHAGR